MVVVSVSVSQRCSVLLPPADHVPVSNYVSLVVEVVIFGGTVVGCAVFPPSCIFYFVVLVHVALHGDISVMTFNVDVVIPHGFSTTGPLAPQSFHSLTPDTGGPSVGSRFSLVDGHFAFVGVHSHNSSMTPLSGSNVSTVGFFVGTDGPPVPCHVSFESFVQASLNSSISVVALDVGVVSLLVSCTADPL